MIHSVCRQVLAGLTIAVALHGAARAAEPVRGDSARPALASREEREAARLRRSIESQVRWQWPKVLGEIPDERLVRIVDPLVLRMQQITKTSRVEQERLHRELEPLRTRDRDAYRETSRERMGVLMKQRKAAEDALVPEAIAAALTPEERKRVASGRRNSAVASAEEKLAPFLALPNAVGLTREQNAKLAVWLREATSVVTDSYLKESKLDRNRLPSREFSKAMRSIRAQRQAAEFELDRKARSLLTWEQHRKWEEFKKTGKPVVTPPVDPRIRAAVTRTARGGPVPNGFFVELRTLREPTWRKAHVMPCSHRVTGTAVRIAPTNEEGKDCPELAARFGGIRDLCKALLQPEKGPPLGPPLPDILTYVERHNTGTFPEVRGGAVVTEVSIGLGDTVIRMRTDLTDPAGIPRRNLATVERIMAAPVVESLLNSIAAGQKPVDGFVVSLQKHGGHRGTLERLVIRADDANLRKAAQILKEGGFVRLLNVPSTQVMDFAGPEIGVVVHSFAGVCGGPLYWPIADRDGKALDQLYDRLRPLAGKAH